MTSYFTSEYPQKYIITDNCASQLSLPLFKKKLLVRLAYLKAYNRKIHKSPVRIKFVTTNYMHCKSYWVPMLSNFTGNEIENDLTNAQDVQLSIGVAYKRTFFCERLTGTNTFMPHHKAFLRIVL